MYYAFINGNYDNGHVITCKPGQHFYDVASGLENKTHDLLIYKRTDGGKGTTAFLGLKLDDGARLVKPDPRPKRKIEIYGDSISTGLGCDRARGKEHSREATDNFFSYGAITARNFDAELHCISKSGIGLIKSWWPTIMPQYYDRLSATSLEGSGEQWDFSKWQPSLVIINLFQNDSWTIKKPNKDQVIAKYVDFVKTIRGHYPNTKIVCVLGSMSAGKNKWAGWVQEAVKQVNDAGDTRVSSYIFKIGTGNRHPNKADHAKMAAELTAFLRNPQAAQPASNGASANTASTGASAKVPDFEPDPSKRYYIDCPATGERLSAAGPSVTGRAGNYSEQVNVPVAVAQSMTSANEQWKFVANDGKWHVQRADGGHNSRLRTVSMANIRGVALTNTSSNGGWTQFIITDAGNGKWHITAPGGADKFQRLEFPGGGKIGMAATNKTGAAYEVVITEVGAK
jgi:hypothetical protein